MCVHACRRAKVNKECGVQSLSKFFRQCRSTALQKTTRYSPFAAVLALTGGSCSRTTENEFGCSGEQPSSLIPTRPKFFGTAEPCSPEKTICYSPFAIRYSLPFYQSLIASRHSPSFWLGRSLALPFFASSRVPRPSSHSVFVPRPASHDSFRFCPVSLVPCPV